jgi:glutathione peroxidase-family protein
MCEFSGGLSLGSDEDTVLDSMLTVAGKLLLLVEAAPRCKCGGNCETLQFLANKLTERKVREGGWQL